MWFLFSFFFFFLPESCKVHSRAYNECKLAQLHGREICEKSPTGCFREVTESWTLQEQEVKSSTPQTDRGTAISHCCADSFGVWWMLSSFTLIHLEKHYFSQLFPCVTSQEIFVALSWPVSCHNPLSLSNAHELVLFKSSLGQIKLHSFVVKIWKVLYRQTLCMNNEQILLKLSCTASVFPPQ